MPVQFGLPASDRASCHKPPSSTGRPDEWAPAGRVLRCSGGTVVMEDSRCCPHLNVHRRLGCSS